MILPNGYEMTTTFWEDFTIADAFGISAIEDTYKRAFDSWKDDYVYLTELVIVLNWKMWQWYEKVESHPYDAYNEVVARVYNDLWKKADAYACENLKGEEASFFYRITD